MLCFVSFQDDQNEDTDELKAAEAETCTGEENTDNVKQTLSAQVLTKAQYHIYAWILLTSFPHTYLRPHVMHIHSIKSSSTSPSCYWGPFSNSFSIFIVISLQKC